MAYIRVDQAMPVFDGQPVTFKSPASCVNVEGLKVHYPNGDSTEVATFALTDAHGNNVGGKDLFASSVLVKVILDTELNRAYVQNADTNAYLEGRFASLTATYPATVSTSWTPNGDYFYQDITVSGILATDNPIADILTGDDNAANMQYSDAICKVFRITTSANSIRVWATEEISIAFPIQLKVVR